MARNMVLTYLHQLDPGDLPLTVGRSTTPAGIEVGRIWISASFPWRVSWLVELMALPITKKNNTFFTGNYQTIKFK